MFSDSNPSEWKHSEDKSEYIYLPDPRIHIVRDSFDQVTDSISLLKRRNFAKPNSEIFIWRRTASGSIKMLFSAK